MMDSKRWNFPVLKMIKEKDIKVIVMKRTSGIFIDYLGSIKDPMDNLYIYEYLIEISVPMNISSRKIMIYIIHKRDIKKLILFDINHDISSIRSYSHLGLLILILPISII
jgi:hypothetical protein